MTIKRIAAVAALATAAMITSESTLSRGSEPLATSGKIEQIEAFENIGAATLTTDPVAAICYWGNILLSRQELELLYTTVYCEAGNQSVATQAMVAQTILNRMISDTYPDTLEEVIYQPGQFEVTEWPDFEDRGWTEQVERAVELALDSKLHPAKMLYFRSGDSYHSFGQPYMKSGDMYFTLAE